VQQYTTELQKLFLEMFLADAESFVRAQNIFRYSHYDASLRDVAKFVHDYAQEYKTLPDVKLLMQKLVDNCNRLPTLIQNTLIGFLTSMKVLLDTRN